MYKSFRVELCLYDSNVTPHRIDEYAKVRISMTPQNVSKNVFRSTEKLL